jgi:glucose-6-phosphate-specific signal transduction histidine kinase
MEEQFEKYIRENKNAFDSEEVPEGVWEAIRTSKTLEPKRFTIKRVLKYAAAAVLISAVSILAYDNIREQNTQLSKQATQENSLPEEIQYIQASFELENKEAEMHFQEAIPENHEMHEEVKAQLDLLENERKNLIQEFSENYQDPRILEGIADVYRMKIEIIEDAVRIIKSQE